jgi:hypothetical protein
VLSAVQSIEHKPNQEPHHKSQPVLCAQRKHHHGTHHDSEDRNEGNEWRTKGARKFWLLLAQHEDSDADQYKREEGTDTRHLANDVPWNYGSE